MLPAMPLSKADHLGLDKLTPCSKNSVCTPKVVSVALGLIRPSRNISTDVSLAQLCANAKLDLMSYWDKLTVGELMQSLTPRI